MNKPTVPVSSYTTASAATSLDVPTKALPYKSLRPPPAYRRPRSLSLPGNKSSDVRIWLLWLLFALWFQKAVQIWYMALAGIHPISALDFSSALAKSLFSRLDGLVFTQLTAGVLAVLTMSIIDLNFTKITNQWHFPSAKKLALACVGVFSMVYIFRMWLQADLATDGRLHEAGTLFCRHDDLGVRALQFMEGLLNLWIHAVLFWAVFTVADRLLALGEGGRLLRCGGIAVTALSAYVGYWTVLFSYRESPLINFPGYVFPDIPNNGGINFLFGYAPFWLVFLIAGVYTILLFHRKREDTPDQT